MSPGIWKRVRAVFRRTRPERLRREDVPAPDPETVGSPSAAPSESQSSGGAVDPALQTAPTALAVGRPSLRTESQSLDPGQIVAGRFRVLQFLGSGGMGEVYEAWDSELSERVALKTIRSQIASLSFVIERFKQEVRQARGISHVNVCRVYEVFSHEQPSGTHIWFLTMELLEGQTLAERLRQRGPFEPQEALDLVEQMVAGVVAAHELRIVHRDFKSSNVMLVDSAAGKTRAVITDFGLALKVLAGHHIAPEESKQGTARYMAPEQARGEDVGFAADQYALGVVMCEMLTGECPARPDTASGTDKVLLPVGHDLNPRWEAVIRRCLEFRPEDRFPAMRDVASALRPEKRSQSVWVMGAAAFILTLGLAGIAVLRGTNRGTRVEGLMQLTPGTDLTSRPSLSRDGTMVAYSSDRAESGNLDIWIQHFPSSTPIRLTSDPSEDLDPNLAPDGSAVVFRSERDGGGIYIVDVAAGGGEHLLVPYARNPRFSPDGRSIAYWLGDSDETVPSGRLFLWSRADHSIVRLAPNFVDARLPVWSPDGKFILFTGCPAADHPLPACSEWWVIDRQGTRIENTRGLAALRREEITLLDLGSWYGNAIVFGGRHGATTSLWEIPISPTSFRVVGKPQQLTSGDAREVAPSTSDTGAIAFEHLTSALHVWRVDHASDPAKVVMTKVTHDAALDVSPNISPNGRWLVFLRGFSSKRDIWIKDLQSGSESPFVVSPQEKLSPIIDDSGETLAFEERVDGVPSVLAVVRGQAPRRLCTGCSNPTAFFDGHRAVFCREGTPSKIRMVDLSTGEARTVLEAAGTSISDASWSPKSEYLLFTASRDGSRKQTLAVSFPKGRQAPIGPWLPVTGDSEFSIRPRWSGDGKTVFYVSTRDGFSCLWRRHFDAKSGAVSPHSFGVMHYHNPRFSPDPVLERSFSLSVSGDSLYLNLGEVSSSVWMGSLKRRSFFSFLGWL